MNMKAVATPHADLKSFLELVLVWHCFGDIPMTRVDTANFIESDAFERYLESINEWCGKLGLEVPARSLVVKQMYELL